MYNIYISNSIKSYILNINYFVLSSVLYPWQLFSMSINDNPWLFQKSTSAIFNFNITIIPPSGSPRIPYNPIEFAIFFTITNDENRVVCISTCKQVERIMQWFYSN